MTAEKSIRDQVYNQARNILIEDKSTFSTDELGELYEELLSEFRHSFTHETDVPCESCRHYSSKSVARQLDDRQWVGWTYWFGGGKHGDPGAVEWIEEAYFLEVKEVPKIVLEFTKI